MELHYLDFETSEDDAGACTFDAMASVTREHWARLEAEVLRVLAWGTGAFGPPAPLDEGGEWDCELHAVEEVATPLAVQWSAGDAALALQRGAPAPPRIALSLTVTGSPAFCEAFRHAFALA